VINIFQKKNIDINLIIMDSKKIFITISIVLFLAIIGYVLLSKQPTTAAETAEEAEAAEEAAKKAAEEAAAAAEDAAKKAAEEAELERVLAAEAVVVAAEEAAAKKAATILAKKAAEEAAKKAAEAAKKAAMIRAKEAAKKAERPAGVSSLPAKKFALLRSYTPNGRHGEPVQVKWGYRTGSKRNNWQCDTICRGAGANFYSTSENGHCGCTINTQVRDISELRFKSNFPGSHPTADWDVKTDYVDYTRVNEE
jgi:hypothetical protein